MRTSSSIFVDRAEFVFCSARRGAFSSYIFEGMVYWDIFIVWSICVAELKMFIV